MSRKTVPKNGMRPIHPGEVLREEFLVPLNLSPRALAMEFNVPASGIYEVVRERRAVTLEMALRLARYFGTTPHYWLNLQTSYDLKITERELNPPIGDEVRSWRTDTDGRGRKHDA